MTTPSGMPSSPRSVSTPGGGVGTGAPMMASTTHAPRTTGEVRFATEVAVRMLPWPSMPRRGLSAGRGTRRM
jgi:hypothetical protein